METERNFPQPPLLRVLERVAVHAVPVGIGGEAEGSIGGLAATTEKTACVAGNLVASDGDVLKHTLLYRVVVGIEGGDGELGQYVLFGVWQGEDVEGGHAVGNSSDFSLLRVDATVASRWAESRGSARIVELQLSDVRRDFLVG